MRIISGKYKRTGNKPAAQPAGTADNRFRQRKSVQRIEQHRGFRSVRRTRPLRRNRFDQLRIRIARSSKRHCGRTQSGALQLHPPNGSPTRAGTLLSGQSECIPLFDYLPETIRSDFFRRPLRFARKRNDRFDDFRTSIAASGRVARLRAFETNGFFGQVGILAIKELRKRAIFFFKN